jgi:hypothetical protein
VGSDIGRKVAYSASLYWEQKTEFKLGEELPWSTNGRGRLRLKYLGF